MQFVIIEQEHHGLVVHLEDYAGELYINDNTFKNTLVRYDSCENVLLLDSPYYDESVANEYTEYGTADHY
jgi:hypothetical protein